MYAILLYHGIEDGERSARAMDDVDREYVLDRARFEQHIAYLAAPHSVPVVISFDDGDLSGYTMAAPALERRGLRGEFYVVTQWIGEPGFMTADQLRELARRGHGIYSHSRSHPRLSSLTAGEIEHEVAGSKADLEAVLQAPVTRFSIPGGAYDDRVVESARRAGYSAILNSVEGYNDETASPLLLRRFTPRSYSDVSMLAGICERPRATAAKLALKRTVLSAARRVMGRSGYERLRRTVVRRAGLSAPPHRRP